MLLSERENWKEDANYTLISEISETMFTVLKKESA